MSGSGKVDLRMPPSQSYLRRTFHRHRTRFVAGALLLLILTTYLYHPISRQKPWFDSNGATRPTFNALRVFEVKGFVNHENSNNNDCADLLLQSSLGVTDSIHVDDDLVEVATSVNHPLIQYPEDLLVLSFPERVAKTWARMSGSSVWLNNFGVYMTVSRVIFYDKGVKEWPIISFLRLQLHDASWRHLTNHTLEWHGMSLNFPLVVDMDAPYILKGAFYGPEDPRIIIEHDVLDPEPVIIFNMIANLTSSARSMYAYRPFSSLTTKFQMEEDVRDAEKNWAPFFMTQNNKGGAGKDREPNWPSHQIYFVYEMHNLRVLQCHLFKGTCQWFYKEDITWFETHEHKDLGGAVMRGGTNFEPLPQVEAGITTFVGFPRTHTKSACQDAVYRPELMIMTTDGTHFWFDYVSEVLDFGTAVLDAGELDSTCGTGRILIANSVASMDLNYGRDDMVVTFSVGDATVQVAQVQGVQKIANEVRALRTKNDSVERYLNATSNVLLCSIDSAVEYEKSGAVRTGQQKET